MRQQIKDRAYELADIGIKLIPLQGKMPYLKSWNRVCSSDKLRINGWFDHPAPERNLGLVLGQQSLNIVCVDIDPRNGGLDWLEEHSQIHDDCLCSEVSGKMDGGMHFFFRAPDHYLKSRVIAKGVDYLGNGKQVVVAPSVHPDTGISYMMQKGDLANPFCHGELPSYVTDRLSQHRTLEEIEEKGPIQIKESLGHGERKHLMMLLDRCNADKGGHYQIGGWVLDAIAQGMEEQEIITIGNSWLREKRGREPQYREIENLIRDGRKALSLGTCYVRERIDPEGIAERFEEKSVEQVEASKEHLKNSTHWTSELRVSSSGGLQKTSFNVRLILENDEKLQGKVKKNSIQETLVKLNPLPWDNPADYYPKYGRQFTDEDTASLKHYISDKYAIEVAKNNIEDALLSFGQANAFHPIRDWLLGLQWDGKERLDSWTHLVTRCEDTEYNKRVGRILIMGLVARVIKPGIKFDDVIVFEGIQGCGKSTLCKELVSEDFFCETPGDISSNQTIENSLGHWLIEIPEIESYLYRYKSSELKRFLSTSVDTIRLPYGRRSQRIPRQFLMVGTTNKEEYLVDTTGNRRYLPIKCGLKYFDFEWLKTNRDQIYAEALQRFKDGETFYQDQAFSALSVVEQGKRMLSDPWANKIGSFMTSLESGDGATITDIWEKCFLMTANSLDLKKNARITRCLISLGFSEETKSRKWRAINRKGNAVN